MDRAEKAGDAIIRTEGIRKDYVLGAETVYAVRGVTLVIQRGEFVAIMGPSGSGKSTFMNVIGCLDTPTAGKYWLNGHLVSELSEDQLARVRNREIGFVFQTFNLLPRATALHNVELPLIYSGIRSRDRRKRAVEALELVGLGERMGHKPPEMSGGQRQRVAIARALVNKPALLLADEPTGNLDSENAAHVLDLFAMMQRDRGLSLVVITHSDDVAERADRVIKMRDGRVRQDAAKPEVPAGLYR
jgi:putative ABC transport system ATP-binding protein